MGMITWRQALAESITQPQQLLELLEINNPKLIKAALQAATQFPLRVPQAFVARMKKGDPSDPLLRQVLPLGVELEEVPGFKMDPLQERPRNPVPALLHKFHNRVLLIVTAACAVHCRYCFRRHFPYDQNHLHEGNWEAVLSYIEKNPTLTEVILSGGDPLSVSDQKLSRFVDRLQQIPHIRYLRLHTRLPIVLPARVCDELLAWLSKTRFKTTVVLHCNHPQEIDDSVAQAVGKLKQAGILVLNQAVLLRGVNDKVETLVQLSEALFEAGVLPYYLFLLDKVQGAAHFDLPEAQVLSLYQDLSSRISGYLLPKLAREEPGAPSKRLLFT